MAQKHCIYPQMCVCLQEEARRVALKQRAEQTDHSESLGWEEEDEEGLELSSI